MTTQLHKNLTGADAVHQAAFVQSTDPGSVGASLWWTDTSTSPPTLKLRNTLNTAWIVFATGPTGATGAAGSNGTNGTNGTNGATGQPGVPGTNIVSGAAPYINIQEQQASGTASQGTFTSGAYRTRTLNTITANDQFLATLAANQITLPVGLWRCSIRVPAQNTNAHKARLQNITDATTLMLGTAEQQVTTSVVTASIILGRFALTSPKVLEVQHRFTTTGGGGPATSFGDTETYTIAEFWLEGPPPPFFGTTNLTAGQQQQIARSRPDFQQHSLNTPPQ